MGETVRSRFENIVQSIIDSTPYTETAHSKEEELLLELKEVIEEGGGGGGDVRGLTQAERDAIIAYLGPEPSDVSVETEGL